MGGKKKKKKGFHLFGVNNYVRKCPNYKEKYYYKINV